MIKKLFDNSCVHTDKQSLNLSKIRDKRGETLTETLVSLLVICIAIAILSGAIVSAAKINRSSFDIVTEAEYSGTEITGTDGSTFAVTLTYTDSNGRTQQKNFGNVKGYETADGFYYYER
ncbi:MAG: hypothetical protein Q4D13_02595 [Erysipelotrichaceae bacterium]|nr:hypothetical protein [Erysipelotrichaceae bacterium]